MTEVTETVVAEGTNGSPSSIAITNIKKTVPPAENGKEDDVVVVAGSASGEDYGPLVRVSKHPVLSHKMSVLRSSSTNPSSFRSVLREITYHLGYEATADLTVGPVRLTVPDGGNQNHVQCTGKKLEEKVALVPIMRSGLGMVDPMLELLPNAGVHHIGMYKQNLLPVQYYNRLPRKCDSDVAYVLDPLMSTAQTTLSVVGILKKWGVAKIHIVSVVVSRPGLEEIRRTHPDVRVTVGEVDAAVNDKGVVFPGLGDAGDRLYGTPLLDDDDEESLMHQSKRKRSF